MVRKAGEPLRIAERRAFHYLAWTLAVARELSTDGKVRAAFQQETRHGQPRVMELRNGVKDGSLPTDAMMIECRPRIDVGPAVEKHSCSLDIAVFGGHVQERRTSKSEEAGSGDAEIQFRERPVEQRRVSVKLFG